MSRFLTSRSIAIYKYISFIVASILFMLDPLTTIKIAASEANIIFWHGFMVFGGIISLIGAIMKWYLVEALGLPLLAATLVAYTVVLFISGIRVSSSISVGLAFLMITAILGLIGRAALLYELSNIEQDIQGRS